MLTRKQKHDSSPEPNSPQKTSSRTPLWQVLLLPVLAVLIFFALLEGGLALFGVQPALQTDDPFVGFASNSPLFVSMDGKDGNEQMVTAPNKKDFFNRQNFPDRKARTPIGFLRLAGRQPTVAPTTTALRSAIGFENCCRRPTRARTGR
jgi:hypothetical protein